MDYVWFSRGDVYEKQYAIDKNRIEIAHQQEIRLLKNEIERLKEQRDKEIVSSSLKDAVINTKDTLIMQQLDTIKQLNEDKDFLKAAFIKEQMKT